MPRQCSLSSLGVNMNWTVQCAEYYLYRGVSRTNAYEFMQQSGGICVARLELPDYPVSGIKSYGKRQFMLQ